MYDTPEEGLWVQGAKIWQNATASQEAKNRAAFVVFGALLSAEFVTDTLATANAAMSRVRGVTMEDFGGDYGEYTTLFAEATILLKEVKRYSVNQEELKTLFMAGLDTKTGLWASAFFEGAEKWEDLVKKIHRLRAAGRNRAIAREKEGQGRDEHRAGDGSNSAGKLRSWQEGCDGSSDEAPGNRKQNHGSRAGNGPAGSGGSAAGVEEQ